LLILRVIKANTFSHELCRQTSHGHYHAFVCTALPIPWSNACPLEASQIENVDLLDVIVAAVLATYDDHLRTTRTVQLYSQCAGMGI